MRLKRHGSKKNMLLKWLQRGLMLLLPLILSAGCADNSPRSDGSPQTIPALSVSARQPATPPECLPTCSGNLSKETDSWQHTLTTQQLPDDSVKDSTTP